MSLYDLTNSQIDDLIRYFLIVLLWDWNTMMNYLYDIQGEYKLHKYNHNIG